MLHEILACCSVSQAGVLVLEVAASSLVLLLHNLQFLGSLEGCALYLNNRDVMFLQTRQKFKSSSSPRISRTFSCLTSWCLLHIRKGRQQSQFHRWELLDFCPGNKLYSLTLSTETDKMRAVNSWL